MIAALRALALTIALWGLSSSAFAQMVPRTFVSVHGTDSGSCPATTPCRSLTYAYSQTASRGEIDVQDSGGYSTGLVITRSVSIVGTGALATILVPANAAGITINGSGIDVTLNGLSIDGSGLRINYGVDVISANSVTIKDCVIFGLNFGIYTFSSSGTIAVFNSYLYKNTYGIYNDGNKSSLIGENIITFNSYGIYAINGGSFQSYGDNKIQKNPTGDTVGTVTSVSAH